MKIHLSLVRRSFWCAAVALSFLFLVTPDVLHAQWMKRNVNVGDAYFIEFLDEVGKPNIGFIGLHGRGMVKTTDNGFTWKAVTLPPNDATQFKDIAFKDASLGWAVGEYGTFRTSDGGDSWEKIFSSQAVSVHYIRSRDRLIISSWDRPAQVSNDHGDTWESFGPIEMNGIAAIDDHHVLISPHVGTPMFTTNGGDTWLNGASNHEVWQPVALTQRRWWIAISEGTEQIIKSTDRGFNWEVIGTMKDPTGCVRGDDDNLIALTDTTVFKSTDQGQTWEDLCGPAGSIDTRFWVRGKEIFIVQNNVLWYNPTSEATTNPETDLVIQPNPLRMNSDGCFTDKDVLSVQVNVCNGTLLSAELTELSGAGEFAIDDAGLPKSFQGTIALPVQYTSLDNNNDSAFIKLTFAFGNRTFDTTVKVYGNRSETLNALAQPPTISLSMGSDCRADKQIGGILNIGCDAFTIDSFVLSDPLHFEIQNFDLPLEVQAQSAAGFTVVSKVVTRSRVEATLKVYAHNNAGSRVFTFVLTLKNTDPISPKLDDQHFYFGTTCDPIDTAISFVNPMCDTLTVDSVKVTKSDYFMLSSATVLEKLGKDDRFWIPLRVLPPKGNPAATKVTIFYTVLGEPMERVAWLYSDQSINIALPADTVNFVTSGLCPSFDSIFSIKNILCDSIKVLSLRPAIQPHYEITVPQTPLVLGQDDNFSIGVSTNVYIKGKTSTSLLIRFEAYGKIYDTIIHIAVRNLDAFKVDPKLKRLNFGRISICAPQQRTVYVKNDLCLPMTIESAKWSSSSSPMFTTISQPALPLTLQPGDQDSFVVQFAPSLVGARNAALEMRVKSAILTLDTFMIVEGIGTGNVLANIRDEALSLGSALTCEKLQSKTVVRNDGCETLDIASLMSNPAKFALIDPPLPYTLEPGDSVLVTFETRTSLPGPHAETLTLRLLSKQNVEQLLECRLDATLVKEEQKLIFASLALDSLSGCAPTDTLVTVANPNTCDTLTLDALFGSAGVELLSNSSIRIPPGGSGTFRFRIQPNTGSGTMLLLRSSELDTTLPITYSFKAGGEGETAMSVPTTMFNTNACDPIAEVYTITNNTCADITLTTIDLIPVGGPATRFAFSTAFTVPHILKRGERLTIPVRFDPTATGANTAALTITGDYNATHQLTGDFTPVPQLGIALTSSGLKQVIVGNSIGVDVALSTSANLQVLFDEIVLEFTYDRNLLIFKSVIPQTGFTLLDWNDVPNGVKIRLRSDSTAFNFGDPVMRLIFRTVLYEKSTGAITLSRLLIISADPRYTECILSPIDLASSNDIEVQYLCEDALLRDALRGEPVISNIRVRPHPVSSSTERTATLHFESATESEARFELVDVLGVQRWNAESKIVKGENTLEMPVTGLNDGWHLLKINTPLGTATSKILISK